MNQPMAVLDRVEGEIATLLVAGLATQRGGWGQLEALAEEVSALKMERLATELRAVAHGQDPAALAGNAFTALAMARKLRERLVTWPEVDASRGIPSASDANVRLALAEASPESPDIPILIEWLQSGNELVRAHAAELLVRQGEEALPELARLANRGTVTIRREAIAAIGKIGGEAALRALLGMLGDVHCWRALMGAILPYGTRAVPPLADLAAQEAEKKTQDRRRAAAALLYRLGAYEPLKGLAEQDEDSIVFGFALAAQARGGGGWERPARTVGGVQWNSDFLTAGVVALAEAEVTGDLGPAVESIDGGAVNEVKIVARWIGCGSPIEETLAEHCVAQFASSGRAKDRDRAASALKGLAFPSIVPRLAGMVEAEASAAIGILGETGGSSAIGLMLDLLREGRAADDALSTLEQLGDPGSAPALLEILASNIESGTRMRYRLGPASFEHALAMLGDGVVGYLAAEMQARQGTPVAASIQRALLQIKGPRAKKALEGSGVDSEDGLLARLGQPNVSEEAIKQLIRHGDAVMPRLEAVLAGGDIAAWRDAMSVLAGIASPSAMEAVRSAVESRLPAASTHHNASCALCAQGIRALSKRKVAGTMPLFVQALDTGAPEVQSAASLALCKIGQETVPLVMPLLGSAKPAVRARAIELLGVLKAAEAEEKAISLLGDPDWSVRSAAAKTLSDFATATGNQRVIEALGQALLRGTLVIPWVAIEALGAAGQRTAIPYLRKLAEIDKYHRAQAEAAIKAIEASAPASPAPGLAGKLRGLFRR